MPPLVDRLEAAVQSTVGIVPEVQGHLASTAVILVVWTLVQRVARRIVVRAVDEPSLRFQANKASTYAIGTIALAALAHVWVHEVTGLATYLGLLSAGVAIAFQDVFVNLGGWIFLVVRRPFAIGHRIQIGSIMGDVVDIRPFRILLLEIGSETGSWVHADQSTGRLLHVPNGWVFKHSIANYDQAFGYIWNELEVTVTFESNWRKAKAILEKTVADHAEHLSPDAQERIDRAAHDFHIKFSKLTPVVWVSVEESGVCLSVRYLCKPRERRASASEMWECILDAFAELPDVDLAYPTTRRFDNVVEGKPGARAAVAPVKSLGTSPVTSSARREGPPDRSP